MLVLLQCIVIIHSLCVFQVPVIQALGVSLLNETVWPHPNV